MSVVLAVSDNIAAARPVLGTAPLIGQLTGSNVEVVHVHRDSFDSVEMSELLAAQSDVPFRMLEGPVEPALQAAIGAPEVIGATIGARATPEGARGRGRWRIG